mmetsp:Transcript_17518/g.33489  ORF Transcript_17518/g.33489 Transcript_17518/m.33489 type:complete len:236 (+) Transcript_17518:462-1169(+)
MTPTLDDLPLHTTAPALHIAIFVERTTSRPALHDSAHDNVVQGITSTSLKHALLLNCAGHAHFVTTYKFIGQPCLRQPRICTAPRQLNSYCLPCNRLLLTRANSTVSSVHRNPPSATNCGRHGWRVELSRSGGPCQKGGNGPRYGGGPAAGGNDGGEMKCYECGDVGHFARDCRARSGGMGGGGGGYGGGGGGYYGGGGRSPPRGGRASPRYSPPRGGRSRSPYRGGSRGRSRSR